MANESALNARSAETMSGLGTIEDGAAAIETGASAAPGPSSSLPMHASYSVVVEEATSCGDLKEPESVAESSDGIKAVSFTCGEPGVEASA